MKVYLESLVNLIVWKHKILQNKYNIYLYYVINIYI